MTFNEQQDGPLAIVDWGTSSFRIWLAVDGEVVSERRSRDGLQACGQHFYDILEKHMSAIGAPGDCPVVMCGMIGARQGWVEAPYVNAPTRLERLADLAVHVPHDARKVFVLPGVAQRHSRTPDVMRGEETQLLGAAALARRSDMVACMPGTHSKWVSLASGEIRSFSTFMTGELFKVLGKHTVIAHSLPEEPAFDPAADAFRSAVETAFLSPDRLLNLVFMTRSRSVLQGSSPTDCAAHLSGLLIGAEVAGARASLDDDTAITLIASGELASLYSSAFQTLSISHAVIDAEAAVRNGLLHSARSILDKDYKNAEH